MSNLNDLKTYYQNQAEAQPESDLSFTPGPRKQRSHPVRTAILIAAAFVLIATTALAATGTFGQIFWSNDAQMFQTAVSPHAFSAQLRAYMESNTPESWNDGAKVYRLTFDSLEDFASFFGVTFAHNTQLTQFQPQPVFSGNSESGSVTYTINQNGGITSSPDAGMTNINVTVLYYPAEDYAYVIGDSGYTFRTTPAVTTVGWEAYFWCSDTQTQPRDLTRSESGPYEVTKSDVQNYTSKTSGVEAVISWDPQVGGGSGNPGTAKMYNAHFTLDNIFYALNAYSNDPNITSADILKTVIDGYQR